MKPPLLVLCPLLVALAGCQSYSNQQKQDGQVINEPAGAQLPSLNNRPDPSSAPYFDFNTFPGWFDSPD